MGKRKTSPTTMGCLILIILISVTTLVKVLSPPPRNPEFPSVNMIEIIDLPARLNKENLKDAHDIGKIPVGTKLRVSGKKIHKMPIMDVTYYQVKYKGIEGYVSEYCCKRIQ